VSFPFSMYKIPSSYTHCSWTPPPSNSAVDLVRSSPNEQDLVRGHPEHDLFLAQASLPLRRQLVTCDVLLLRRSDGFPRMFSVPLPGRKWFLCVPLPLSFSAARRSASDVLCSASAAILAARAASSSILAQSTLACQPSVLIDAGLSAAPHAASAACSRARAAATPSIF
jgi:hypothetical protein